MDAHPDEREAWLQKAKEANAMALQLNVPRYDRQWLPVTHYHRGLILAYSGAPLEDQLAEFLESVNYSQDFALALRSTGIVYYQMAKTEVNSVRQRELAEHALSYLRLAFEASNDDVNSRQDRLELLLLLKSNFPELPIAELEGIDG